MKRSLLILFAIIVCTVLLHSETVGNVKLYKGKVRYRDTKDTEWKDITLKTTLASTGMISIDANSWVEIQWLTTNKVKRFEGRREATVRELMGEAPKSSSWSESMRGKLDRMSSTSKPAPSREVAAVRRDEATVAPDTTNDLTWIEPEKESFDKGYALYTAGKSTEAVPVLEQVIQQDSLSPQAERARSILAMIYLNLNQPEKSRHHLRMLIEDFPNSTLKEDAQRALEELQ